MPFGSLWLPVTVSAVAVFVVSSVLHMLLKYHKADYKRLPNEDAVRDVLGKAAPSPGLYYTPYCVDMKDMQDPAVLEKYAKGPVALITVLPTGMPKLQKHLALWFGFSLLVSFFAGYVARHVPGLGASSKEIMRVTGSVAFAGYGLGRIMDSIWKGQPWANTAREMFDAGIYALVTAATFALLWPS